MASHERLDVRVEVRAEETRIQVYNTKGEEAEPAGYVDVWICFAGAFVLP